MALRHRLRRYALQREVRSHGLFQCGIGAEHDLVPLDHRGGSEVLGAHRLIGVALALQGHLEAAEVVEHHQLTFGEGLDDMVLHAEEHGAAVGLRHGGAVVDAAGQLVQGELTRLDGLTVEILGALDTLRILYSLDCVGNWHGFSFFVNGQQSTDNSQPPETNVNR